MPKYKIREEDNTGSLGLDEQQNIVYIPGGAPAKTAPKLYRTVLELNKDAGLYLADTSFALAKRLLRLGMQVLYQGFEVTASTAQITSNAFEIDGITYSISGTTISWTEDETTKESTKDSLNCAVLSDGLMVKIGSTSVTYPVAEQTATTPISLDNKFTILGVEYQVINNTVYDGTNYIPIDNGKCIVGSGTDTPILMILDYLHRIVSYTIANVSDGVITIGSSDWKELEDKNLYNFRFLTTGGYACPSQEMIACAANRGDCVALLDHPNYDTYSVETVRSFFEAFEGVESKQADPLAFASAFTPWFTAELEEDTYELPASAGYLLAYARSISSNPVWKAVAGVHRGIIPELVDVSYVLNNAECEVLQARATTGEVDLDDDYDNLGLAINPIAYRRYSGFNGGFNYVINGNRTMHINTGKTIATSFLNVRILISEISKTLYDASIAHTFEQNSDVLWTNFEALVTPLLDRMQSGEGIEGYKLERIPTTKKARLCARVTIVPIEAVEDFDLTISLEDSIEVTEE